MKTEHLTLPALQFAAAAFFASGAQAADQAQTYCVDVNDTVLDIAHCEGAETSGSFFLVDAAPGTAVGSQVTGIVGNKIDSTDEAALEAAGFSTGGFGRRDEGVVTGGFGRRQDCGNGQNCGS